jgi:hypothetical protein
MNNKLLITQPYLIERGVKINKPLALESLYKSGFNHCASTVITDKTVIFH